MSIQGLCVNIDANEVSAQYQKEQEVVATFEKKTQYDEKNYLNARLLHGENTKTLTIRLLPTSKTKSSPFTKVFMHTIRVNKNLAPSGWKSFVCPTHNRKDGDPMGDKCPFCATSAKARELRFQTQDELTRKKYNDVEFMNRAKEMWVVRCIERGHEEDGVKFWMFNNSKKKDGVYDKIMNLFNQRLASSRRKGNEYNIFDLENGLDLIITLNRTSDGKTSIQIVDEGMPSPLSENVELANSWIEDTKKWYDVYTVKPYEYLEIVAMGGVPVYDKEKGTFVDKEEAEKLKEEAEKQRIAEQFTKPIIDYSTLSQPTNTPGQIIDGNTIGTVVGITPVTAAAAHTVPPQPQQVVDQFASILPPIQSQQQVPSAEAAADDFDLPF